MYLQAMAFASASLRKQGVELKFVHMWSCEAGVVSRICVMALSCRPCASGYCTRARTGVW